MLHGPAQRSEPARLAWAADLGMSLLQKLLMQAVCLGGTLMGRQKTNSLSWQTSLGPAPAALLENESASLTLAKPAPKSDIGYAQSQIWM